MRYAPTTSQTNRFSEPAQVDHGKPSDRAAGQNSSSANSDRLAWFFPRAASAGELLELRDLALEPGELRGHDEDVRQHDGEDDEIDGGDVLLGRGHVSSSRSDLRRASRRL